MTRLTAFSMFLTVGCTLAAPIASAAPVDGTFSYQGRLTEGGAAVTGTADLRFRLYDAAAAGAQVGSTITLLAVPVADGLFNVELDFGAHRFNGDQRWLEIDARDNLFSPYTTLTPRQPILGTPYAIQTRGLYVSPQLNVGIGTTSPGSLLEVSGDAETEAIYGNHTGATGTAIGTRGQSASTAGRGVYGYATSATGFTFGLYGRSDSADGKGTFGSANAASGTTYGVYGQSLSPNGTGVFGTANANSGVNYGVYGQSLSPNGTGVYGLANNTNGVNYGVFGRTLSPIGAGVSGEHDAATGSWPGVLGKTNSQDNFATGVRGTAPGSGAVNYGVHGQTLSTFGYGVYGEANAAAGANYGVGGRNTSVGGTGVFGLSDSPTGSGSGVIGRSDSPDGYGGYFLGRGYFSGDLGIGQPNPETPLHIDGGTDAGLMGGGYVLIGDSVTTNIVIDDNEILARDWIQPGTLYLQRTGKVEVGNNNPVMGSRFEVIGYAEGSSLTPQIADFSIWHQNPGATTSHPLIHFNFNGSTAGQINASAGGVDYFGFTGAHYAHADEPIEPASLVVMTGDNTPMADVPDAEPVYGIAVARTANDPRVLGAHRGPATHDHAPVTDVVAAVGNGVMWVTDDNRRNIEPGDYLISSDVPGCAMLDDPGRFVVGHIVAQAGARVDWSDVQPDASGVNRAKVAVQFERFDRQGDARTVATKLDQLQAENDAMRARLDYLEKRLEELTPRATAARTP